MSTHETGAMDAARSDAQRLNSDYWLQHRDKLFVASCIALIVTAMSFAIRGALIGPLGERFDLNKEQMGYIVGTAFWGFAVATVIGGSLSDVLGMGRVLTLAFIGHVIGIVMTIFAGGFWTLFFSTLSFGMANGFVEGACNPLIATLYPDQKIKRLSLFHAWFPGGIVIGGLVAYFIDQAGIGGKEHGWQIQMATMLIPLVAYGMLFLGKKFPQTERVASNISTGQMFKECLRPFFLLFVICMVMTAATELVTGQWMPDILTVTTGISGIIYLVLINGLMALGRTFAGPLAHRVSPVGMLIGSSIFSGIGLFLLSRANNLTSGIIAAIIFAIGVCFFWPTMLGVVSERFPKSGALGMAIVGGAGMLSTSVFLPIVGHRYDAATAAAAGSAEKLAALKASVAAPGAADSVKQQLGAALATGGQEALQTLLYLPVILTIIFAAIYLYDKSRGGYKEEVLMQDQQNATA